MAIASFTRSALNSVLRHQNLNFRPLSSALPFQLPTTHSDGTINRGSPCRPFADAAAGWSVKSVPVQVAYDLLQAGHQFLDVRTPEEFALGHPTGAINVPYVNIAGFEMAKNPKFLEEVKSNFGKDTKIVVGCKVGKRSLVAATELIVTGYTSVTDMAGGYNEWIKKGLPISKLSL